MDAPGQFTSAEGRSLRILCIIYASRLLGLYMVLPVLSPYAASLAGTTSVLTGLSIGAYGATQAFFQLPIGYLSDRIGRKRAIYIGLILFAAGSLLGSVARDAWTLVAARALQGAGAISAAIVALAADLTRDEVRTQAMSRLGIWIGGTFAVSVTIGPALAGWIGVPPLFLVTAVGAVLSIALVAWGVPEPPVRRSGGTVDLAELGRVLRSRALLMLDAGIFLLHIVVTVLFVILPFDIERAVGPGRTWMVVAVAIVFGLVLMNRIGRLSDHSGRTRRVFLAGALILSLACLVLTRAGRSNAATIGGLFLVVAAVAILEPLLAALLSRFVAESHRGSASGLYSMSQYLGAFCGGLIGGAALRRGRGEMFLALGIVVLLWGLGMTRVARRRLLENVSPSGLGGIGAPPEPP